MQIQGGESNGSRPKFKKRSQSWKCAADPCQNQKSVMFSNRRWEIRCQIFEMQIQVGVFVIADQKLENKCYTTS